jgi:pimeloyl-ACP methyl ester carboxylesterase
MAAGLEKFAILGGCQGAAVGIAYAVRHPERVPCGGLRLVRSTVRK